MCYLNQQVSILKLFLEYKFHIYYQVVLDLQVVLSQKKFGNLCSKVMDLWW